MLQQSSCNYTAGVKTTRLALQKVFFLTGVSVEGAASVGHSHHEAETAFKVGPISLRRATLRLQVELMLAWEGSSVAPSGSALGIGKPWIITDKLRFLEVRLGLKSFSSLSPSWLQGTGDCQVSKDQRCLAALSWDTIICLASRSVIENNGHWDIAI